MSAQIAVHAECSSGSRTVGQVAEVLIVDDNPIDRLRAGRLINQDPRCHATYAEDGTQALARLANHPTSVVLTDLQMEGMDGLSLVRAIHNEHPQVPVIVMTGHGSEDVAMEALRVGATDYVPKQRLAQELHAVLSRASGRRRRAAGAAGVCSLWSSANRALNSATIQTSFPRSSNSFRRR